MKRILKNIFHIDHVVIVLLALLLVGLTYVVVISLPVFDPLKKAMGNMSSTDLFFKIGERGSEVNQDITIVDIGDEYNRGNIARIIARVDSLKPWVMGIDVMFQNIKGEPEDNIALFETAMTVAPTTVWASKLLDYDSGKGTFGDEEVSFFADTLGVSKGFTNLDDDLENLVIRKMLTVETLGDEQVMSLPVAMATALGDSLNVKPHDKLTVNFNSRFVVVPADSLLHYKELIAGHAVIVGTTTDQSDHWNTPIGKIPGVVLQAHSLNTMRNHTQIGYAGWWVNLIVAFVLCYIFSVVVALYNKGMGRVKAPLGVFLYESQLPMTVITLVYMALVTWMIMLVFLYRNYYLDSIFILVCLGFVLQSRLIFKGFIKSMGRKHQWCIVKNSIFNE